MGCGGSLCAWDQGRVAGLSALVEKPSRRTELALYTLPRAADSSGTSWSTCTCCPTSEYGEEGPPESE